MDNTTVPWILGICAVVSVIMTGLQIFVIPTLRSLAGDVKETVREMAKIQLVLAELKGADLLAASLVEQAHKSVAAMDHQNRTLRREIEEIKLVLAERGLLQVRTAPPALTPNA